MKLLNFRSSALIAIICFVLGSATTFILTGNCGDENEQENIIAAEKLQKQLTDKEAAYQTRISELQKMNSDLIQELTSVQSELFIIKLKTKSKEASIKKRIQPKTTPGLPAKDLLKKAGKPITTIDSSISSCDSLVQEVAEYLEADAVKDSLYETQITLLDSMVAVKDAIIYEKDFLYNELKINFATSLEQQQILASENSLLKKRLKKQKRRSRLFTLGATIIAGIAANYLLSH